MDYFLTLYGGLPRAGPGDNHSTAKAFSMIEGLPPQPRILDIGCGPGAQTLELLRLSDGTALALDLFPQMLERIRQSAKDAGFSERLETIQLDMNEMEFEPESFDAIWSEGALYFIGFEQGLKKIKEFVKQGGFVAVSEAVWLIPDPPQDVLDFWAEYPEIDFVDRKLEIISNLGYENIGHFILPASSWSNDYYAPMEKKIAKLEPEWQGIPEAEAVIKEARQEIAAFKQYSEYFSYAFFVMKRPS